MRNILYLSLIMVYSQMLNAQKSKIDTNKRNFIGSTLFILFTPIVKPSPEYFQLNYGRILSPKDVLSIEAITWSYPGPLGRPYGKATKESDFPGKVRAFGIGLAYKRFLWERFYVQIHSTPMFQNYIDTNNKKIQSGFQLFNTVRAGYHFEFFKNRMFLEPSLAVTFWPINTNLPSSFQEKEDKWPNYFLLEPGLHFGYNF